MNVSRNDWPGPGPIDLAVHDLPHPACGTEWWYVNSHVRTVTGRSVSMFAAFFRWVRALDPATKRPIDAHSLTWAVSDADGKAYHAESRVDPIAPKIGLERIEKGRGSRDPRLNRALREILERGNVPAPDRKFEGEVFVGDRHLELDFAGARFEKRDDGSYRVSLYDARTRTGCELTFSPEKSAVRHGDDGVVRGPTGEDMFYYFIPRCRVTGEVTIAGSVEAIAQGSGWYDHEFGAHRARKEGDQADGASGEPVDVAWNWTAAQLDDGTDVTAYTLVRCADGHVLDRCAVVVDREGRRSAYGDFTLTPSLPWRSKRTFFDYPTHWALSIPAARLEATIVASFDDQELITVISKPAFWEGRCDVTGTIDGRAVRGLAYIERSGFEPIKDLDGFFTAVGEEVRKSVASVLPLEPTREEARELVASAERDHYMDGVDVKQLSRALLKPIREMTDRGGKSWRSYAALACCDVVQGDSRKFVKWLAMPELLHVGSLIVDDVQDRSDVRRGGPACHLVYGEPIAINAGTAAYFLTQKLMFSSEVSDKKKLRLYDLYFEAMRGGHAGQALDLDGPNGTIDVVLETGDSGPLERRILATHRFKAAVPAAALARMGAVVGGGTEAQIEAVGRFFEALGLAFQIVDDVLNLRGFKGNLKSRGEDVSNGTVTLPVAKAMGRLGKDERAWVWSTLLSKPTDPIVVSGFIEKLEACGAIAACVDEATELVESAWRAADPLLEDSVPKIMLRAFGWYVLERHY